MDLDGSLSLFLELSSGQEASDHSLARNHTLLQVAESPLLDKSFPVLLDDNRCSLSCSQGLKVALPGTITAVTSLNADCSSLQVLVLDNSLVASDQCLDLDDLGSDGQKILPLNNSFPILLDDHSCFLSGLQQSLVAPAGSTTSPVLLKTHSCSFLLLKLCHSQTGAKTSLKFDDGHPELLVPSPLNVAPPARLNDGG